MILAANIDKV